MVDVTHLASDTECLPVSNQRHRLVLAAAIATALLLNATHANAASRLVRASTTAGRLDPTFGHGGFGIVPQQVYSLSDVRESTGGTIVVAVDFAGLGGGIGGFGIARFTPNGTPDPSFGSAGVAVAPFTSGFNVATSTATQSDGKIVAVGSSETVPPRSVQQLDVARFTSSGALDPSFGSGGRVVVHVPGATGAGGGVVLVAPNGQLLVGAAATFAAIPSGIVVRLNNDGTLDTTFGQGGVAKTGRPSAVNGLGLERSGKIVALGGSQAMRFLPSGAPDPITTRGRLVAETHHGPSMLERDERIVVAEGLSDNKSIDDRDAQAVRLFPDGSVDTSFQSPLFDFITSAQDQFQQIGQAVVEQADAKVVMGGVAQAVDAVTMFGLARFTPLGAFDGTFGSGGITVSTLDGNDELTALGLQSNGDILAAGLSLTSTGGAVVARYLPR